MPLKSSPPPGVHLIRTKDEKDAQFLGKVHPWDAGKKFQKLLVNRRRTPEKQKEAPTL